MGSIRLQRIRQKAEIIAQEAKLYPKTAHVAQTWLLNAQEWAFQNRHPSLERHISLLIAALIRHRRERLERLNSRILKCGNA